jgi:hypothetical protein
MAALADAEQKKLNERGEKLEHLVANLTEQNANKSNLSDNAANWFAGGVVDNPTISKIDYFWWHSGIGQILTRTAIEMDTIITNSLVFTFSLMLNQAFQYAIAATDLPFQNHLYALLFMFLITVFWKLCTSTFNSVAWERLGSDTVIYKTKDDLELTSRFMQLKKGQ